MARNVVVSRRSAARHGDTGSAASERRISDRQPQPVVRLRRFAAAARPALQAGPSNLRTFEPSNPRTLEPSNPPSLRRSYGAASPSVSGLTLYNSKTAVKQQGSSILRFPATRLWCGAGLLVAL